MITTLISMDPWIIATFIGASFLLYLTPGADMMFTIASGVAGGPRAGLAAALYLLHIQGENIQEAKKQLGLKYLHVRASKTGVLDHILDLYEADCREAPLPIREWVQTKYTKKRIRRSYRASKAR